MAKNVSANLIFPSWLSHAVLAAVVVTAAGVIWALMEQNQLLKEQLNTFGTFGRGTPGLAPGDVLPDLVIQNKAGGTSSILSEVPNGGVLAFLTTTCPYCEDSLAEWHLINSELTTIDRRFIAVSLNSFELTKEYVRAHEVAFPVWTLESPGRRSDLRVGAVPLTVTVTADGRVARVWRGRLTRRMSEAILASGSESLASERDEQTSSAAKLAMNVSGGF